MDDFHDGTKRGKSFELRNKYIGVGLDMLVDFPRHDLMETGDDVSSVVVVTSWEFVSQKVLLIEDSEVEAVEGGRVTRRGEAKGILKIENCVVVWSEDRGVAWSFRCQDVWSVPCKRRGRLRP